MVMLTVLALTARPAAAQSDGQIELPWSSAYVSQPFVLSGYAVDLESGSGPGVDQVQIYACPYYACSSWTYWGTATYGLSRPDIADAYGDAKFTNSGYQRLVAGQAAQTYLVAAWAHSAVWDLLVPDVPGLYDRRRLRRSAGRTRNPHP